MAKHVTYCRNCAATCGLEITEEAGGILDIAFSGRLVSLDEDLETINFMPRQSSVPVQVQLHEPT